MHSRASAKAMPLGALEGLLHTIGGTAGAAALAIVGVAAALLAMVKSTADSTNELRVQAAQAGTNIQEFQKLSIISQLVGGDQALLSRSLSKLNEDMALAADKTSKTGSAFAQLGVAIKDNNGNYRDTAVVFQDLLEKVTNLKDEQSKIAALTDIFGARQARLMLPMLDEMKTKYGEMSAFAEEVGAVATPKAGRGKQDLARRGHEDRPDVGGHRKHDHAHRAARSDQHGREDDRYGARPGEY